MSASEVKTIMLRVNGDDAEEKINELRNNLKKAREDKMALYERNAGKNVLSKEDKASIDKLNKDIQQAEKELRRMNISGGEVEDTLSNISKKNFKDLKRAIKAMTDTLNRGEIERGSDEWNKLTAAIRRAKEELKKLKEEQKVALSMDEELSNWGTKWVGFTSVLSSAHLALSGIVSSLSGVQRMAEQAVTAYADMAEAQSQVTKYTGLSDEEVRRLNDDFKKMDTRTSREQLNALAGDAGRLGITAREDVLAFVEAADMINVALGEDLGEDAVKNIGKLAQLFGDDQRMGLKGAMLATGSVINDLAQSSSAAEGYIVEFTGRLAGAASQAGMTQAQVMGLASVMDQSMINAEEASTALSNLMQKMYREPAKLAKAAGLNVKEFTQLVKTDANAALMQFAQAVGKMSGMQDVAPMLADLQISGAGVSKTLMALAQNTRLVTDTQQQAARAFADGTSVMNEYEKANSTPQAELEKTRKRLHDLTVELGEKLMPVASAGMEVAANFAGVLSTLIDFTAKYSATALALAVSFGVLRTKIFLTKHEINLLTVSKNALKAAMMPWKELLGLLCTGFQSLTHKTKQQTAATVQATTAQKGLNTAQKASPWGLLISLITTAIALIWDYCSASKAAAEATNENAEEMTALQRIRKKEADSTQETISRINRLTEIIQNNAYSYNTKKQAMLALERMVPGFHANLGRELALTKENTKAIQDYIRQLGAKARAEAYYEELVEVEKKINQARREKARKDFNVESVNAELARNPEKYASRMDTRYHRSTGFSYEVETNRDRIKKMGELNAQKRAQAAAEKKINDRLRERKELMDGLQNDKEAMTFFDQLIINETAGTGADGSGTNTYHSIKEDDKADQKRREAARRAAKVIDDRARREQAQAAVEFQTGQIQTWEAYQKRLLDIDTTAIEDKKKLWQAGDTELLDLDRALAERKAKDQKERSAWSLRQIDTETEARKHAEDMRYLRSETTETEHQQALDRITLDGLTRRRNYLRQYAAPPEDIHNAEVALAAEEQRQAMQRERTRLEAIHRLREEYLKLDARQRYEAEIRTLDAIYPPALLGVKKYMEEYQRLRRAIDLKYKGTDGKGGEIGTERREAATRALDMARKAAGTDNADDSHNRTATDGWGGAFAGVVQSVSALKRAEDTYTELRRLRDADKISQQQYNDACAELDKGRYDRLQAVAQAAYASVNAIAQSASQLMQANAQVEEAKITRRYDAEIKKAGENSTKGRKLEEQKQKELAKVKAKYNKKAMAVEIAQAVASTAMNAIQAYGAVLMPHMPWTLPLAIAAAAAATAAGMMQVATIKKQHEAQAQGYYSGGFTPTGDPRREAGTVHRGEFVANHRAVSNPALLPVLRLIDRAQRTNTVAGLTPQDVSRAIAAPQTLAQNTATLAQNTTALTQNPAYAATLAASRTTSTAPAAMTATQSMPQVQVQVVDPDRPRTAEALERLLQRLDQGIESYVVLDGPEGLHRQYQRYQRLLARK